MQNGGEVSSCVKYVCKFSFNTAILEDAVVKGYVVFYRPHITHYVDLGT